MQKNLYLARNNSFLHSFSSFNVWLLLWKHIWTLVCIVIMVTVFWLILNKFDWFIPKSLNFNRYKIDLVRNTPALQHYFIIHICLLEKYCTVSCYGSQNRKGSTVCKEFFYQNKIEMALSSSSYIRLFKIQVKCLLWNSAMMLLYHREGSMVSSLVEVKRKYRPSACT